MPKHRLQEEWLHKAALQAVKNILISKAHNVSTIPQSWTLAQIDVQVDWQPPLEFWHQHLLSWYRFTGSTKEILEEKVHQAHPEDCPQWIAPLPLGRRLPILRRDGCWWRHAYVGVILRPTAGHGLDKIDSTSSRSRLSSYSFHSELRFFTRFYF